MGRKKQKNKRAPAGAGKGGESGGESSPANPSGSAEPKGGVVGSPLSSPGDAGFKSGGRHEDVRAALDPIGCGTLGNTMGLTRWK